MVARLADGTGARPAEVMAVSARTPPDGWPYDALLWASSMSDNAARRWREVSPLDLADAETAAVQRLRAVVPPSGSDLARSPAHTVQLFEVVAACDNCNEQVTVRGTAATIVTAARAWSQTHQCTT